MAKSKWVFEHSTCLYANAYCERTVSKRERLEILQKSKASQKRLAYFWKRRVFSFRRILYYDYAKSQVPCSDLTWLDTNVCAIALNLLLLIVLDFKPS